ncbi:DUF4181 domain-containing protein [Bacillus cereus]|uniref:DUF4181 domain-containing protein n=1 Tax=Bacillus cereus TaxID=1396 RepID=UPI00027AB381|nr:DUF4181 domain-containing protein [Bacillus cereus]EJS68868.1 hypothetical protein ICU_02421 [Bacillus cereus BAG2X1-1]PEA09555.1 DUF4181 domain-containing protein [Bacillus cereus]PFI15225.1 DUF4181 domain-containing protein [Bacillus cereus]
MGTSTIFIIIIVLGIVGYFLEQFLRKKLNMKKRGLFGYKYVNSLHMKLEIVLFFIYFITCFTYINSENVGYVMFIFFGTLWTLRAWMEWKYDRESKEYILSIIGLVAFIIMISLLLYFQPFLT